jgi:hypothetical protein
MLPIPAPVLPPARRRIRIPTPKVHRRLPVVAHRDTQNEQRHTIWFYKPPWAIVPGTGIPVVALKNPVHTVVKEIVGIQPRRVIHGIARDRNKFRIHGQVDPYAHMG